MMSRRFQGSHRLVITSALAVEGLRVTIVR